MSNALSHIKKYNALNGQTVSQIEIGNVLFPLQNAIKDKKITAADPLAKDVQKVQSNLVKAYNEAEASKIKLEIVPIIVKKRFVQHVNPRTKKTVTVDRKKAKIVSSTNSLGESLLCGLECIQNDSHLDSQTLEGTKSVYDFITEMIVNAIKDKGLIWRKGWQTDSYQHNQAVNYVTKKEYKGINAVILNLIVPLLWGKDNPYFMTMNQVRKRKANVKQGAKSIPVIYYKMMYKEISTGASITEEQTKKMDTNQYTSFPIIQYYKVFSGDDIEGVNWPINKGQKIDFKNIETAEIIVNGMPKRPPIKHGGNRASYTPAKDVVNMPPKEFFKAEHEYYGTLFHELIHSTGHKKRVGRFEKKKFDDAKKSYAYEELIAELGASFLCGDAGILYHTLDNTAAYIQGWEKRLLGELKSDNKFIFKASAEAQKAADFITGGNNYSPKIKKKQKPKKSLKKEVTNRPAEKPKSAVKVVQTKLFNGLNGFTPLNEKPDKPDNLFTLPGPIGQWLGEQQRERLVISLDGETHAGKSELAKQLVNAMAAHGFNVAWFDLEQGGLISKDTLASFNRNVDKANMKRIGVIGEAPNGIDSIREAAKHPQVDVIAIDSATKLVHNDNSWFEGLRNEFPNKIFIPIWQQNAQGGTRGGSGVQFDAPVHIKVYRPDHSDYKKNYATFLKNRGNATDQVYYMVDQKIEPLASLTEKTQ